jgi:hypothetical protein
MFKSFATTVGLSIALSASITWAQSSTLATAGTGPVAVGSAPVQPGEPPAPFVSGEFRSPSDVAWGISYYANNSLVYFTLSNPGTWTTVGSTGITDFVNSTEFAGTDFSVLYALGTYQPAVLYAVSTASGTATSIDTVSGVAEHLLTGLAWNPTDAAMFLVASDQVESYLYRLDLATAVATLVGPMNTPLAISLAINCRGEAYCHDLITDTLLSVDLSDGAATTIGPLGFDALFGQGMDFDDDTGELYMAAVSSGAGGGSHLRLVNTATGEATILGTLEHQLGSLAIATTCSAGVTYQGRLQWQGAPLNDTVDLRFRLFDAESGGGSLGRTLDVAGVLVADGLFTVSLDFGYPFGAAETWLEIAVAYPAGSGNYTTLSPRQLVGSAPRAHFSARSDFATSATWDGLHGIPADFADGVDDGGDGHSLDAADGFPVDVVYVDAAGLVGVGTIAPTDKLTVAGVVRSSTGGFELPDGTIIDAAADLGLGDITAVTAGSGLTGGGTTGDVTLAANFAGTGSATTVSHSDHYHSTLAASDGTPASALSVDANGNVGVGTATPVDLLHVFGGASGATANGNARVVVEDNGGNYIHMLSPTANETGILFGDPNLSIRAALIATNADTLQFRSGGNTTRMTISDTGNLAIGGSPLVSRLYSESAAGIDGLRVRYGGSTKLLATDNGGTSIGANVTGPTNGLRVAGNCDVIGTLTKGGGSFKIDHPLDPENWYLYHSFVESPDMMNVYNGNIITDEQGYATVELPDWFEALNRDFRYQLTVLDESEDGFVLAKVYRKISQNQFIIKTSVPGVEVSWQVTGIRKDAWAEQNRIQVEAPKEPENRGRYLHPEVFGLSKDFGLDANPEPDAARR